MSQLDLQSQQKTSYLQPAHTCCKQNNNVYYLCSNYQCSKSPIMCKNLKCNCHNLHSNCLKTQKKSLIIALQDKQVSYKNIQQEIQKQIYQSTIKLQQIQNQLLKYCKNKKQQQIGLTKEDKQLLNSLVNGKLNQLTGIRIYKTMSNLIKPQKITKLTKNLQQDIKCICDKLQQNINLFQYKIKKNIRLFNQTHFSNSKIIANLNEQNAIQRFFQNKKIKKLTLLFRASQNKFSASKFHKMCDEIPQTITLCLTQNNHKFGGYSKVPWNNNNSSQKGICLSDNSSQSFLFFLNQEKKFSLHNKNQCIYYDKNHGPTFGNYCQERYNHSQFDFCISDKCNQVKKSTFKPETSFKNLNKQLNQNINLKFSVLEYEVWKVQFDI